MKLRFLKKILRAYPPLFLAARDIYTRIFGYNEPEFSLIPFLVDPDCAAIDVGAHTGAITQILYRLTNRVIAIEANPVLAKQLERALNGKAAVISAAASSTSGRTILNVPANALGRAAIDAVISSADEATTQVEVQQLRLDELDTGRTGFIKVDVEGHELEVLKGAESILERDHPTLLVEAEERHRHNAVSSIVEFLHRFGYRGYMLDNGVLRSVEQFDPARDQHVTESIAAELDRGIKSVRYINNFVFISESR